MISHVWTVVCSRSVIDRDSNNFSLLNTLERVTIHSVPMPETVIPMRFDVVTWWTRTIPDQPGRGRIRLQLRLPSGTAFSSHEAAIDLSENEGHRHRVKCSTFPIAEAGRHLFVVELMNEGEDEWTQVASVPLRIQFKPPEGEQQTEDQSSR